MIPCIRDRHAAAVTLTGRFLVTWLRANGHYHAAVLLLRWKIEGRTGTRIRCEETPAMYIHGGK